MVKRVIWIVLDSVGIGALPDASHFGDEGADTLGNIARHFPDLHLPNLNRMGLGNIEGVSSIDKTESPTAAFCRAMEVSMGKDTTTGHWELAGLIVRHAFPTYPNGFPAEVMSQFEQKIGIRTLGNKTASGTAIIEELGERHLQTHFPIVYTSADSVFQIALHEDIYPVERQYEICQIARDMLVDDHAVSRVIARPFVGSPGHFQRTANRKDFSLKPPGDTVLNLIQDAGMEVVAVGKIWDIFAGAGISKSIKTKDNMQGVNQTLACMDEIENGLVFTNLVDFDMLYGHRRKVEGYAHCLMEFDARLPELIDKLRPDDVLVLTADHGNDPTFRGTDHTREYVPMLLQGKHVKGGTNVGTRTSFADLGATVAEMLGVSKTTDGESFWNKIKSQQD